MKHQNVNFGEARPLFLFKNVGGNLKNWGEATFTTFVREPLKEKDYVGATIGTISVGVSAAVEALDYGLAGIADKELKPPQGSRLGRDVKEFGKDLFGGHFLRAGLDVLRVPGSAVMDGLQLLTRGKLGQTLNP